MNHRPRKHGSEGRQRRRHHGPEQQLHQPYHRRVARPDRDGRYLLRGQRQRQRGQRHSAQPAGLLRHLLHEVRRCETDGDRSWATPQLPSGANSRQCGDEKTDNSRRHDHGQRLGRPCLSGATSRRKTARPAPPASARTDGREFTARPTAASSRMTGGSRRRSALTVTDGPMHEATRQAARQAVPRPHDDQLPTSKKAADSELPAEHHRVPDLEHRRRGSVQPARWPCDIRSAVASGDRRRPLVTTLWHRTPSAGRRLPQWNQQQLSDRWTHIRLPRDGLP